ncbi:histidine phosphatase family protein [Myceligenerans sp. I2]|uniref:Histidine phosphatase family protein n=2 Tax=Myceligenerans indicum TaxID=2593663 RepID=A0ABS1LP61_9MICO|nr:histidine phosphatase family protein [Myceligenerans indicum]
MRRLVLLRHAKAEPATASDDALRPLALRGRTQAAGLGAALVALGAAPDVVLVSSALRTRQTWNLAKGGLNGRRSGVPTVVVTDALYNARVSDVLGLVADLDESARTVLVIGHEPTMAATAAFLAGPGSDDAALAQVRVGVPTATYSLLEAPAEVPWSAWERSSAVLTHVGRPPG